MTECLFNHAPRSLIWLAGVHARMLRVELCASRKRGKSREGIARHRSPKGDGMFSRSAADMVHASAEIETTEAEFLSRHLAVIRRSAPRRISRRAGSRKADQGGVAKHADKVTLEFARLFALLDCLLARPGRKSIDSRGIGPPARQGAPWSHCEGGRVC